jgi:DNA-binding HxlR family transcriptional regulator
MSIHAIICFGSDIPAPIFLFIYIKNEKVYKFIIQSTMDAMRYDLEIDDIIINGLNERDMHWNELYRHVRESHKHLSYDAFTKHLKILISKKLVDRNDIKQRGVKVFYFLTEEARQQLRLKILQSKSSKGRTKMELRTNEDRRQLLFILLLLFRQRHTYHLETEQDFDDFLSMFNLTGKVFTLGSNKLEIAKDKNQYYRNSTLNAGHVIVNRRELVDSRTQQSHSVSYRCNVRRISIKEISNPETRPAFWHVKLTEPEINDAVQSLCEEGLIRPFMYQNEPLYFVVEKSLEVLLDDCYILYKDIYNEILHIWEFLRKPTPEEVGWLELFEGTKRASEIRNETYKKRKAIREDKRPGFLNFLKKENKEWEKELGKMVSQIMTKHSKTIQEYRFPTEKIFELIYPEFLHESFSGIS